MSVIEGKIHRLVIDGVDVTECAKTPLRPYQRHALQELEDALATPGTARRLCVMPGSNMGNTVAADVLRGCAWPTPTPRPIEVCEVCGCAHRNWKANICSSCDAGIHGVRTQQMMERFTTAMEKLSKVGAVCCASFRRAAESMTFFVDSEPIARAFSAMHVEPVRDVSPAWDTAGGDPIADILRARDKMLQASRQPLIFFDEICPMPVMPKLNLSSLYGSAFHHPPAEPRPKRDRKNRGPAKHSEWWNKGKRW